MEADLWDLYRQMLRSRLFEEAVAALWQQGLISGEMHLGVGEEAIVAGVVAHLQDGDAIALDHRGTPPLVMRGVDLASLLAEFLGLPEGLCHGMGGHMHLFSPEHLIASSGIVGASAPTAAGFALAAQQLRTGKVAVAFFGEGATNQGMLLETLNLATLWKLPLLFVCKDNSWAITTQSEISTAGNLVERVRGFGLRVYQIDGTDVEEVWSTAGDAILHARRGDGPAFLLASCFHLEGHFLGDALVRLARNPLQEMPSIAWPMVRASLWGKGAPLAQRLKGLLAITTLVARTRLMLSLAYQSDPLIKARARLLNDPSRLDTLESQVREEIHHALEIALTGVPQ